MGDRKSRQRRVPITRADLAPCRRRNDVLHDRSNRSPSAICPRWLARQLYMPVSVPRL